jgi:hypothetical protein
MEHLRAEFESYLAQFARALQGEKGENGVMEYWSIGVMVNEMRKLRCFRLAGYSTILTVIMFVVPA